MSGIDTRLLRYFAAAVDEQRFGRAALRLDITLPTLTDQIKKLQSRLGVKLFESPQQSR
jgi:DNA-binding transcriptional LysR family regulator